MQDDDKLDGGTGNDTLVGGSGADTFWLDQGDGQDVVTDYDAGVDDFLFFGNLGVQLDVSIVSTSDGILFSYGDQGDTLLLQGEEYFYASDSNLNFV